ncbi:MFS transporter [Streptomyces sp. NPDC087228]|uniref:MFS transporter n=1 Tax=Streptomyces sp. NPDC087228 TaxID=3365772 RepID=UPI0038249CB6
MTTQYLQNVRGMSALTAGLCLLPVGALVVVLSPYTSIIGVALPEMQADLGFSQENLSWVFNAYVVAFGGLLLGGRLSDLLGARRLFSAGWVVLAAGSLTAGLAGGVWVELAGRALQGVGAAWIPMWFFLNLYLQQVLGLDAFASGSALLPMTVAIVIMMVVLAPRLIARFGPKPLIVPGLFALGAGMFWLSLARPDGNFWVDVLPASLLSAVGMSLTFIPSLGTALSSARPEEGGLASGIVNTSYQVGSALGLAAMTAFAAAPSAREPGDPVALTHGFSAAFLGAAALAVAGALAALPTLRTAPAAESAGSGGQSGKAAA